MNQFFAERKIMTVEELVQYTGFSKSHIYKLNSLGKIPGASKPLGKKVFFNKDKIDAWLGGNPIATRDEIETKAEKYLRTGKLK